MSPNRPSAEFLYEMYTSVDAAVGALVNSSLPIAKGERGQLREHRGTHPGSFV